MTINKKLKKINISTIILILIFLVGLSLLLYPTISDYWNSFHQSRAIAKYTEQVAELNNDLYKQLWEDAAAYNERLLTKLNRYKMTSEEKAEYESLLNVSGNGIIGYIEIEKIDCSLPVYHGTAESALQIAAGHIEGTSLPVGGASTHCVISGHRGLPRAKLFTNLDRLVEGDTFELHILDEILTYEVDQISVWNRMKWKNWKLRKEKTIVHWLPVHLMELIRTGCWFAAIGWQIGRSRRRKRLFQKPCRRKRKPVFQSFL